MKKITKIHLLVEFMLYIFTYAFFCDGWILHFTTNNCCYLDFSKCVSSLLQFLLCVALGKLMIIKSRTLQVARALGI